MNAESVAWWAELLGDYEAVLASVGSPEKPIQLKAPARFVHGLLMLQVALGVAAYFTRIKDADAPQPLPGMIATTVAHVGVGALLLASTFVLAVRTRRYFPAPATEAAASHKEAAA